MKRRLIVPQLAVLAAVACGPSSPCRSGDTVRRLERFSAPYAGHWVVARGDTLTLPDPDIADRFKLTDIVLGTDTVSVARTCLYRGQLVFAVPRAETLAVHWFGVPEHVTVFGWPADVGPFAGLNASWWGRDSLRGAILFDERMGVQVRPGVTAQFWAGRPTDR
ncbi:MAG TPA: hypothetical protein VH833_09045 [Gemmatimonadales bacterium]